jgi:hypothetical protein
MSITTEQLKRTGQLFAEPKRHKRDPDWEASDRVNGILCHQLGFTASDIGLVHRAIEQAGMDRTLRQGYVNERPESRTYVTSPADCTAQRKSPTVVAVELISETLFDPSCDRVKRSFFVAGPPRLFSSLAGSS